MTQAGCKHAVVRLAINACRVSRAYRLLRPLLGGSGVILALHRVVPDTGRSRIGANSRIEISPEFLESLIIFFRKKGYRIVSLDEMYRQLKHGPGETPFVCFTFDDGYSDILDYVLPVFSKYNAPFAVYVVTSFAEKSFPLWWYMLEELLLTTSGVLEASLDGLSLKLKIDTMEEKEAAYSRIREIFMSFPQEELRDVVENFFSPLGVSPDQYKKCQMSWEQVAALAHHPLATVGAHSVHHYNLRSLSRADAAAEIADSKEILQEKTGVAVHHFSFPFGSREECGPLEFEMARKCGFRTAVTIREGLIFPEHRFFTECLPRIEITGRHQDLTLVDMRRCGLVSLLRNGFKRVVTV